MRACVHARAYQLREPAAHVRIAGGQMEAGREGKRCRPELDIHVCIFFPSAGAETGADVPIRASATQLLHMSVRAPSLERCRLKFAHALVAGTAAREVAVLHPGSWQMVTWRSQPLLRTLAAFSSVCQIRCDKIFDELR
jgi:hypothetical protein